MPHTVQLTWITDLEQLASAPKTRLPAGYVDRPLEKNDQAALAGLFHAVYADRESESFDDAFEEIERTLSGEYGRLFPRASPLVFWRDELVAAVLTVHEAPWPDTPDIPFIIEVMVHDQHRRRGLANTLLLNLGGVLLQSGAQQVGLRVMSDNEPAKSLYSNLGFRPLT